MSRRSPGSPPIASFMTGPRIFWLLSGPSSQASSRLHGLLIHRYLVSSGMASFLLVRPEHRISDFPRDPSLLHLFSAFSPRDIVVFQKLSGPSAIAALTLLARRGVKSIFIDCDLPLKLGIAVKATLVLCPSQSLCDEYTKRLHSPAHLIREPAEVFQMPRFHAGGIRECVWFGMSNPAREEEIMRFRRFLQAYYPHIRFTVLSDAPSADVQWTLESCWPAIARADIAVITSNAHPRASAKSPNRAIQAMALGTVVLAFPNPAYEGLIRHGRNGFLCHDEDDWKAVLEKLNNDQLRFRIAHCGYRYARLYYRIEVVGRSWIALLQTLCPSSNIDTHKSSLRQRVMLTTFRNRVDAALSRELTPALKAFALYKCRAFFAALYQLALTALLCASRLRHARRLFRSGR